MRQLRYLRPGEDRDHLILEAVDGEQYVVYVTPEFRDAVRTDLPRLTVEAAAPTAAEAAPTTPALLPQRVSEAGPGLTPREIQMRVRAGADPHQLAEGDDEALERVLRFATPVLEERMRMADEARRARARRSTTEGQTVIFGEAVDQRFSAHGIDPFEVRWDSFRRGDGQWVITAAWTREDADSADYGAEWIFHVHARNVAPLDDAAADLLSDRPLRPAVTEDEPAQPDLSAAPALAPGVVAFPRLTSVAELQADDEPAVPDEVFDQDAHSDGPTPAPISPAALQHPVVVPAGPRHLAPPTARRKANQQARQAQDDQAQGEANSQPVHETLPMRIAEAHDQAVAEATESSAAGEIDPAAEAEQQTSPLPKVKNLGIATRRGDGARGASRPHVPSWDDIMLGVRRPSD